MSQLDVITELVSNYHASEKPLEICWFWEIAKKIDPKVVVEIGVYAGGNLKILSTLVQDKEGLVVGIDYDWTTWKKHGAWDLSADCPVHLLDGDSHKEETLEKLKTYLKGREIDVLFIDGDHSFVGCKLDWDMYGALVRKGGIIAVQDTQMFRRPDEHISVRKCGEFFASLPEPKWEYHCEGLGQDGYGIGYKIKE